MDALTLTEWLLIGVIAVELISLVAIISMVLRIVPSSGTGGGHPHPIIERLANEPALVSGVIAAAAALTASFGFEMSAEQTGAIMALIVAALAVFVRQQVTPVRKLEEEGAAHPSDTTATAVTDE